MLIDDMDMFRLNMGSCTVYNNLNVIINHHNHRKLKSIGIAEVLQRRKLATHVHFLVAC